MTKHEHPPTSDPTPIRPPAEPYPFADPAEEASPEEAAAAAEALLAEGDGQNISPDGQISIDELVTAYGAASLRAEKFQQIVIKQANEIMRLRATLRNVLTTKK